MQSDLKLMSKAQLEGLRQSCLSELRRRYKKSRKCLYGSLNRGFTKAELAVFLEHVVTRKYRVLFALMSQTGLRIGEACSVRWEDIDWGARILYVWNEKCDRADQVPLNEFAMKLMRHYRSECPRDAIAAFPSAKRGLSHGVSPHMARKRFREAVNRSGLGMSYACAEDGRRLQRLSTHSLRHYFITYVHKKTKDVRVAQRLARHTNPSTTLGYIHPSEDELRDAVEMSLDF